MGNFEKYLGGFLGIILAIGFVGMIGGIIYEVFMGDGRHGGFSFQSISKYVFGMVAVIVLSIIWGTTIGKDFIIDPQTATEAFQGN